LTQSAVGLFALTYPNAKIRFQSFFMLMMIQPIFFALSYTKSLSCRLKPDAEKFAAPVCSYHPFD
jgi:hypothetical protein